MYQYVQCHFMKLTHLDPLFLFNFSIYCSFDVTEKLDSKVHTPRVVTETDDQASRCQYYDL